MIDISQILISSAWAQAADATPLPGGAGTSMFMNFLPLILIFGVFYVLIIRPQQKKVDEQAKMIKALRRGDRVITSGGIYGKIARLEGDDILILEIADGVNIKIVRSHVTALAAKTDPANTNAAPMAGSEDEKK
jgi:preprotein translocase subunit YajC